MESALNDEALSELARLNVQAKHVALQRLHSSTTSAMQASLNFNLAFLS